MLNEKSYIGKQIGNYQVISEIARGSFGYVYLAQHIFLTNRKVAIKLLHATYLPSKEDSNRFLQEARFLETLKHPYILPILDVGIYESFPYLVTEYAPNGSLRNRLEQLKPHSLPLEEALTVLAQIGEALYHAHQQNIIHRDLKPENILFNVKGDALLADFGIATTLATTANQPENNIGTPSYMAPEHFKGKVSKESDQYALGCIAYEVFTGFMPFYATDIFSLGFQHLTEPPLAPSQLNPCIPQHIEHAILKAMAKQRADRFPDIPTFIKAFHSSCTSQANLSTLAPNSKQQFFNGNTLLKGLRPAAIEMGTHVQFPLSIPPLMAMQVPHAQEIQDSSIEARSRIVENVPTRVQLPVSLATKQLDYAAAVNAPTTPMLALPSTPSPISQHDGIEQLPFSTDDFTTLSKDMATGTFTGDTYILSQAIENSPAGSSDDGKHRAFQKRWFFTTVTIVLVLLLVGGGILYAISALPKKYSPTSTADTTSTTTTSLTPATVTITPMSKDLKNTYTISAVTGTPGNAQVQARLLSSTTQPQSKTVNANGTGMQPATQASGTLNIENYGSTPLNFSAGMTLPEKGINSSIHLQLNANVVVPRAGNKSPGTALVSAHVVQSGSIGNLSARAVCSYCYNPGVPWDAYNPAAFSGGQDPQSFTTVQQSDLDGAANPLKSSLLQSAQTSIQRQMHSNEQFVSPAQCTTNVTSVPTLGQKASTVTVTVTASCQGEAYDQQGAQALATTLFKKDATTASYTIKSQVTTAVTTIQQGTIIVNANAMVLYQFNDTQKLALAQLIAGKSPQDAQALLLKQPGVSKVTITFSQSNLTNLPIDPGQITIAMMG